MIALATVAGELRDDVRDGRGERELAALDRTQHQHDRDRLGDGEQAENRVLLHGTLALRIRMADGLVQRELAVPADRDDAAEIAIRVDVLLHHGHQVLEPRGIHATRVFFRSRVSLGEPL